VKSSRYICAYFINNNIHVSTIMRKYISENGNEFSILQTEKVNDAQYYDNLILCGADEIDYKILCSSYKTNNKKKCFIIHVKV